MGRGAPVCEKKKTKAPLLGMLGLSRLAGGQPNVGQLGEVPPSPRLLVDELGGGGGGGCIGTGVGLWAEAQHHPCGTCLPLSCDDGALGISSHHLPRSRGSSGQV